MSFFERFLGRNRMPSQPPTPAPPDTGSRLVPFVGRIPFPAYRGDEPYMFISYAHADADEVFPLIRQFHDRGYRVWYDEGIAPGNEWTDDIARALKGASVFVVLLTPTSERSPNVRNEINFAVSENIPFLAIHLRETELSGGLKLQIGMRQAILKYNMSDEEFLYKYTFAFEYLGLPKPIGLKSTTAEPPHNTNAGHSTRNAVSASQVQTAKPSKTTSHSAASITPSVTKPRGVAVVSDGARTFTTPANALYCMNGSGIYNELVLSIWDAKNEQINGTQIRLPKLSEITCIEMKPHPDGVSFHRLMSTTKLDGSLFETDIKASSTLALLSGTQTITIRWQDIVSISINWSDSCLETWPSYARICRRSGKPLLVPAFSICFASRVKPSENSLSWNQHYQWRDDLKMTNGHSVVLSDLSCIAFGKATYVEDRWAKDWIKELPIAFAYMDGRHMEAYLKEDYLKLYALDEFGPVEITPDKVEHIDFVQAPQDVVAVPTPPESTANIHTGSTPKIEHVDTSKKHAWGDYEPKGVAHITMKDGSEFTGVANSFVLKATHMQKNSGGNECLYTGLDTPRLDDSNYDLSDMKNFLDIVTIENTGDCLLVTDYEEEETKIRLPDGAEFWYLGTQSKFEPCKVTAADVQMIRFARRENPDIPIKYCTVTCKRGSFRSPAAFLTVSCNVNRGIVPPIMRLRHDFTKCSGYPCKTRSLARLVCTKPGTDGSPFSRPSEIQLKAVLKNGEDVDFSMDGYFSIFVMSRYGVIRSLSRSDFQEIDFE